MGYNACIVILSSRHKCLEYCLRTLYKHYNNKYDYPVYVHYFDDIYDDEGYRKKIHDNISSNIHFISVPYKTPSHIEERELFYNRKDLHYARKKFSIKRKGYLHMCNFTSNMYGYENTHIHEYDYVMTYDDESGYVKDLPYDPVDIMANREEDMGALISGQRLKNGAPHQGHLDTRFGLWVFTKKFLKDNNIEPKFPALKKLMKDPDAEYNFHFLPWSDSYVIKTKMFETEIYKKWTDAVNENGGIYKGRWGDNEIVSLFYMIYDKNGVYNLKTVEDGYHNQGLFRKLQSKAPSVKNTRI